MRILPWWFFLGLLGAHHFRLGRHVNGLAWLTTFGGFFGLGWLVDLLWLKVPRVPGRLPAAASRLAAGPLRAAAQLALCRWYVFAAKMLLRRAAAPRALAAAQLLARVLSVWVIDSLSPPHASKLAAVLAAGVAGAALGGGDWAFAGAKLAGAITRRPRRQMGPRLATALALLGVALVALATWGYARDGGFVPDKKAGMSRREAARVLEQDFFEMNQTTIKEAYRRLSLLHHPDKVGAAGALAQARLNEARQTLRDTRK